MKVFELAKELDIGAIDLVEKLKSIGMTVRNHMVALTDEEVVKARTALAPAPVAAPKAVKKVTRKVVKKEEAETSEATTKVADEKASAKAVTVKRKSKIVKKKSDDEVDGVDELIEESKAEVIPKRAEREVVQKDYLDAKSSLHTFTPVYVPEDAPAKSDKTTLYRAPQQQVASDDADVVADTDSISDDDVKSKKRFGAMATAVSKKSTATRSQEISLLRADEEMKLASSYVGTQIYSPAKKKKVFNGITRQTEITEVKESKRVVVIHDVVTALELANKLSQKFESLQNKALELNLLLSEDDYLGVGLATELANLYNFRVENRAFKEEAVIKTQDQIDREKLPSRNPVIAIMGHVDHGKTSLLDYIRKAKVAAGEAGGITQHIGAYSVKANDKTITFLDTPGHAAFAQMRQRGANITDIVVLVVAADDGVMPQTKESIRFCKNAGVPIIVAVNKMDKPGASPEKIKQDLMEFELTPEEWGGDTQYVPLSALTGNGVDSLLESILIQAEVLDLRESNKGAAQGVVIESKIEQGRGPVATILVKKGTLNKGDSIVVGECWGRARSLMDYTGKLVNEAGPSTPVQILGLDQAPSPGDILNVVKNDREAKQVVENRIDERKALDQAGRKKIQSLEDFFASAAEEDGSKKMLKLIVRTDVLGSFEAIKSAVESLGNNEVGVQVIGGGVGAITDSDVELASSSKGYVIGFNMRPVTTARKLAEIKGVDVKTYSIIYELINQITLALEGMLTPEFTEKFIGRAQVKETFTIPKAGTIAGSSVIDGKIERGCNIRLLRDGKIVFDGKLSSLKRFKDDVREVKNGFECGIGLENFNDVKVDDLFEAYILEKKERKLDSATSL